MQFGHVKKAPFMEILKAAKCPPEYLEAAQHFRCKDCEFAKKLAFQRNKVPMPRPYEFNRTLGMDVNYCHVVSSRFADKLPLRVTRTTVN